MGYLGHAPADQAVKIGSDTILSSHIDDGVIVNADINASAAIATSKVSGALTSVGSHGLATVATSGSADDISSGTLAAARVATLNQSTTGSAATLTTTRAINGVNFNGSAAITVTADANTLSGTTLKSTVVSSSLTSVGTITAGTWTSATAVIASAYLDADTAHLSTTQTFSGAKTFSAETTFTNASDCIINITSTAGSGKEYEIQSSDAGNLVFVRRTGSAAEILRFTGSDDSATFTGNVGVGGATMQTWDTGIDVLHIGATSSIADNAGYFTGFENAFLNASDDYVYITDGPASMFYTGNGVWNFRVSNHTGTAGQTIGGNDTWLDALLIANNGNATFAGQVTVSSTAGGSASSLDLGFGDGDTGFYESGDDTLNFVTAGSLQWTMDSTAIRGNDTGAANIQSIGGAAGTPVFTFNDDPDTGMYRNGANNLAFSTGGTHALNISSDQSATFAGGAWFAGAPGGSSAVANGGKAFGFVTSNMSSAGAPKITFAGGLANGQSACYLVTTGTRSNANARVSVGIVTHSKGYASTCWSTITTLAGNTMTAVDNNSGGTIDYVVSGESGNDVTSATCMQIGGHTSHSVTVICHTT